jgi:DNA invertase Pin-like site-specific DNA recombinase
MAKGVSKKKGKGVRAIGYLRVSTIDQDLEKFKTGIRAFANARGFPKVEFIEEKVSGVKSWKDRKIKSVIDDLGQNDILITPELSRLGRSTIEVLKILEAAKIKEIAVYSVKEGLELNGNTMTSKVMATMLALFAELEHDFISMRTKEALAAKKKAGVVLGRPKGSTSSKLDKHEEEIIALLKTGSRQNYIAKKFGCTPSTLCTWMQKRKIRVELEY